MFFTSGIIIAFFCFAFYLIWNQFLRKDTRLSTGLQVLRKKITDLENLSLTVEAQVDRQVSVVSDRIKKMESLLQTAKELCERLETNIKVVHSLENSDLSYSKESVHTDEKKESLEVPPVGKLKSGMDIKLASQKKLSQSHLKMVKEQPDKQKGLQFGESPFANLDFIESP